MKLIKYQELNEKTEDLQAKAKDFNEDAKEQKDIMEQ